MNHDNILDRKVKKNIFGCYKANTKNLAKKTYRIHFIQNNFKIGRWDEHEHLRFLQACWLYGDNWLKIEEFIKTRSVTQIRSHAQKYLIKLCKNYSIRLNKKKFKKKKSLHLLWNQHDYCRRKLDMNKMSEYDKNIFEIFKYYERDYSNANYGIEEIKNNKYKRNIFKVEKIENNNNSDEKNNEPTMDFTNFADVIKSMKPQYKSVNIFDTINLEDIITKVPVESDYKINQNIFSNLLHMHSTNPKIINYLKTQQNSNLSEEHQLNLNVLNLILDQLPNKLCAQSIIGSYTTSMNSLNHMINKLNSFDSIHDKLLYEFCSLISKKK